MTPGRDPVDYSEHIVAGAERIATRTEGAQTAYFAMQSHGFSPLSAWVMRTSTHRRAGSVAAQISGNALADRREIEEREQWT